MKHVLSVDVQNSKSGYTFTLHHSKKAVTFEVKGLGEGFNRVVELEQELNQTFPKSEKVKVNGE